MSNCSEVIKAPKFAQLQREMSKNYTDLLTSKILCDEPVGCDQKTLISHRKKLCSEDALAIWQILWKEGLSKEKLSEVGLEHYFRDDNLTSHSLAVALSNEPEDVAKTNSLIRSIVIAGAAYGLVERNKQSRTKVILRSTEKLHDFMVELGAMNEISLNNWVK